MKDKSYSDLIQSELNEIDIKQKLLNCNPLPEVSHNLAMLDMKNERAVEIVEKTSSNLTETSTSSISSSLSTSSSTNSQQIVPTAIEYADVKLELSITEEESNKTTGLMETETKQSILNETEIKVIKIEKNYFCQYNYN